MEKYAVYIRPSWIGGACDESAGSAWVADFWSKKVAIMEKRLATHGMNFIAGTDRPTIADFKCFQPCVGILPENSACSVPQSVLAKVHSLIDANPNYKRWFETMRQEQAQYLQQRPPTVM